MCNLLMLPVTNEAFQQMPRQVLPNVSCTVLSSSFAQFVQLTLLHCSAHRDARASRTYSKTNMARCALWCFRDDIFEQYLEWQLSLRQWQMADLYSREQYSRSVKIYKDVTVFYIKARCFGSQLKNEEAHRVFLSSMRVISDAQSRNQQPSTFRTALKYTRNVYKLQSIE